MTRPFRILSLDGGGIMGAFPASAQATFERETGGRIVDHFDLIAGTSTGGIIAVSSSTRSSTVSRLTPPTMLQSCLVLL